MIIYGWKTYFQVLAALLLTCGQCGNAAEHVLRKQTTKVTLFWIPLFPISKKHTVTCSACAHEQRLPRAQAHELLATGGVPGQAGPPPGTGGPGMPGPRGQFVPSAHGMPGGAFAGPQGSGRPAPGPGMPPPGMPAGPYGSGPNAGPPPGYPRPPYPPQNYGPR